MAQRQLAGGQQEGQAQADQGVGAGQRHQAHVVGRQQQDQRGDREGRAGK
ncbi:hypothetical protein WJ968_07455 [Achromobacter xylosoxidans]